MSIALLALPDPKLADLFASIVRQEGLAPFITNDGVNAQNYLKRGEKLRLVVTDLSLPREDGFALLAELRKIASPTETPAVVISPFLNLRARAHEMRQKLGIYAVFPTSLPTARIHEFVRKALQSEPVESLKDDVRAEALLANQTLEADRLREEARIRTIEQYDIVNDLPPDLTLQHLLQNTARVFGVATALISIVTTGRQWFKAYHGIDGQLLQERGSPREHSFCTHVVGADSHTALFVPNAATNPCFSENPLVQSGIVGSYVGTPLVAPNGHVVGTLCLIDKAPSRLSTEDVGRLQKYADQVTQELFRTDKPKKKPVT